MGRLLLIDVVLAAIAVGVWYVCFSRYNRRRGIKALICVETACSAYGRIVEAHWLDTSRLQAQLRFAAHWFDNARITIRLLPRPVPVRWLVSLWNKQRETVTFEADLDYVPGIRLEAIRHRWLTHSDQRIAKKSRDWTVFRPGPIVLTTSSEWRQELPPIVHTLMTARAHNLLSVQFHSNSPHLAATISLDSLSNADAAAGFLGVVRDLAAGASTSLQ